MKVTEKIMAKVVEHAANRMSDETYVSGQVDELMRDQPNMTQYVIAHQNDLGVDGVISVLFHTSLMRQAIIEACGRRPTQLSYVDLDAGAKKNPSLEAFADVEPNLASYVATNVELDSKPATETAHKLLAHIGAALVAA